MSGTPREMSQPHTAFVRSCAWRSTPSLQPRRPGRDTEVARGDTCFPATPSVSYTSFAAMALRSSLWRTVDAGPDTGAHDSETPSNRPLERAGSNAPRPTDTAGAGRSAPGR